MDKMTRYIWCPHCYRKLIKLKGLEIKGIPVIYRGKAYDSFLCDYCNKFINEGDICYAVSYVEKPGDHVPWEEGYLTDMERIEYVSTDEVKENNRRA